MLRDNRLLRDLKPPPEEVKDALERLRPRAWRDDDLSDTDGEEV